MAHEKSGPCALQKCLLLFLGQPVPRFEGAVQPVRAHERGRQSDAGDASDLERVLRRTARQKPAFLVAEVTEPETPAVAVGTGRRVLGVQRPAGRETGSGLSLLRTERGAGEAEAVPYQTAVAPVPDLVRDPGRRLVAGRVP